MTDEPTPPAGTPAEPTRRNTLLWLTGAVGLAAAGAVGIPLTAYLTGAIRKRPEDWVPLGKVADFPLNETRLIAFENPTHEPWDGAAGKSGAYVRHLGGDDFWVFAMNCAHLGCPVTWVPAAGLFMCPCHGGVYYENGDRASGPPPRGLYKMPWRVTNGVLEVQAPHLPTLQDTLDKPSKMVKLDMVPRSVT
ncbi:Rieske (2Fe-2S) protein [soil metagenome]